MRKSAALCLALFFSLLPGCTTIRNKKVLTITPDPGTAKITVAADAVAKCYNLILVELCRLDLNLRQVGGQAAGNSAQSLQAKRVRDFISANYGKIISELSTGSGADLSALLDLLRIPTDQRVEAILSMKGFNIHARNSPSDFAALVVDNLLKSP